MAVLFGYVRSAAGVAGIAGAAVVLTRAVQIAAAAAPGVGAVMYPDDRDGDDHDDPECLIVAEPAAAADAGIVVTVVVTVAVGVHRRGSLLERFLTPFYSEVGNVCSGGRSFGLKPPLPTPQAPEGCPFGKPMLPLPKGRGAAGRRWRDRDDRARDSGQQKTPSPRGRRQFFSVQSTSSAAARSWERVTASISTSRSASVPEPSCSSQSSAR